MRNKSQIVVGLEVGTSKVCAIVGEIRPDDNIHVLGVGRAQSIGVKKGEIVDFEYASQAIYEAIHQAEEKAQVEIGEVYLSVTGSHVVSGDSRGQVEVSGEEGEVCLEDIDDVLEEAKDNSPLKDRELLHAILAQYYVDGKQKIKNPMGQLGKNLEADYHMVYGDELRLKNTVKCVKHCSVNIEGAVFAALASAQAVLTEEDKRHGAILIDVGGGTSDYIVYCDDAVKHTGVLAVGGDHVTNDISLGLKPSLAVAERMKIEHGSIGLEDTLSEETVVMHPGSGFEEQYYHKGSLCLIMRARYQEILEIIREDIRSRGLMPFVGHGVFLTGGASQVEGLQELAAEVFEMPVRVQTVGPRSRHGGKDKEARPVQKDPEFSVVVGLLKYAQLVEAEKVVRFRPWDRFGEKIAKLFMSVRSIFFA
ncbi:MAG: cell division protein FtsA [Verrucomicrobiae bacterium]|nr:cell division protein FtsA [Verrucomicrobiae bacterium]